MNEKLEKRIIDFINSYIDTTQIHFTHEYEEYVDEDGDEVEGENPYYAYFYIGDFDSNDEPLFVWFDKGYFNPYTEKGRERIEQCPMLTIKDKNFSNALNGLFNDRWKEPFKMWFNNLFPDYKIKTVK